MSASFACVWFGESGKSYEYHVFPLGAVFRTVGGNYIFCRRDAVGEWVPLRIGQTSDMSRLLGGDGEAHIWLPVEGATHIHAHVNACSGSRRDEAEDLRRRFELPDAEGGGASV